MARGNAGFRAVVGSPRAGGNSDEGARIVSGAITSRGRNAGILRLRRLRIERCRGCLGCQRGRPCPIRDDFAAVWKRVKEAEATVFLVPVYWCAPPGLMKDFIDRTVVDYGKGAMRGKAVHLVSIAQSAGFGPHEAILDTWIRWLDGAPLRSRRRLIALEKGDLKANRSAVRKLRKLAEELAGQTR